MYDTHCAGSHNTIDTVLCLGVGRFCLVRANAFQHPTTDKLFFRYTLKYIKLCSALRGVARLYEHA